MRALVVCNGGGIGDAFLATPVMRALRARYDHITVLTKAAHASVVASAADEVWPDDGSLFALVRKLRNARFDAAVVTWATTRTALALRLAGIPERVGQARRIYSPLFTKRITLASELGDHRTHWVELLLEFARALGCDGEARLVSPADAQARNRTAALLDELALAPQAYILLHPTRGISHERDVWPESALARVGSALRGRFDLPVIVSGSKAESESAQRIARRCGGTSVAGRTSLLEFTALAESAKLVVAMDSGPMHLAASTDTPTLGIFAMRPDEPDRWHPLGARTSVIRSDYPCPAWHTKERCPDFACVRALDADRVVAAAAGLLDPAHEDAPHAQPGSDDTTLHL